MAKISQSPKTVSIKSEQKLAPEIDQYTRTVARCLTAMCEHDEAMTEQCLRTLGQLQPDVVLSELRLVLKETLPTEKVGKVLKLAKLPVTESKEVINAILTKDNVLLSELLGTDDSLEIIERVAELISAIQSVTR